MVTRDNEPEGLTPEDWAKRLYQSARTSGHDPWPRDELARGVARIRKPSCRICNPSRTINL
jgi:hypothetical protein